LSVADAEDQCQEAFLRAFQNLDKYREKWRFATWLFTIARRCQLNAARRQPPTGASDTLDSVSGREPEPVDALVAVESRQHLWSLARRTLSQPQCDTLWLFYVEEMSIQEVAHVLGRSRVGVRTLLYRARKKMHTALSSEADRHVTPVHSLGLSGGGYFHA
jgi:RNA polymerase sigma-70 factor (ECF subfamily)